MTRPRPLRFGVSVAQARSKAEWVATARKIESHGYSTLQMPDHLGQQLAPIAALQAAAEATQTLRIGSLVLDNDFRHPVLLAKEAATLDLLSGGRFELGLGAGWEGSEYVQAGISFDAPGVRVSRMEEALHLIKGLFADGHVLSGFGFRGLPQADAATSSADSGWWRRQACALDGGTGGDDCRLQSDRAS